MNKILKCIKHPSLFLLLIDKKTFIKLSDKLYVKLIYLNSFNKKMDLKNPKTFNEKLQWLKIYDRKDYYTSLVDKYEVKKHVEKIIGSEYIIPTLGIYDNFDEIDFSTLPNRFVIKCTHDSGGIVICKNKSNFNIKNAKRKIEKCLKRNFYYVGREWPYKNVKPRIIIEQYMEDISNEELTDYKVMCFNSKPLMTFTCSERFSGDLKVTFFDNDWKKMPFERHYKASTKKIKKPINFDLMLKLSKTMSENIPFVRIDWYEINGKLYFGEYTFYPGDGLEEFSPEIWDEKLGNLINLPIKK